ncbi:MAG: IclR family transcriptional regulator [Actinomycetes bacterium]
MPVPPPATVTGRVLALLATFTAEEPELTLTQLSRRTGLPMPTVHRLAGELVAWGALERADRGPFRIGLRLWEVAALAPRGLGLRDRAMPYLEDLFEATRQHVQLAVLDGHEAVYVERLSARGAVGVVSRVGGRLPLHATGVGQVLLAHSPREVQEEVLRGPLAALTPKTVVEPVELRRVLAHVRRSGVAVCDGQVELRSLSVAAPVRGPGGVVVAALSVVVPSTEHGASSYVAAVRAAARGISRALGGAPPTPGRDGTRNVD